MTSADADSYLRHVESRLSLAEKLVRENPDCAELDAMLGLYLSVLATGVLEESLTIIIAEYAGRHTSCGRVYRYVRSTLDRYFQNPNPKRLEEFLGYFDPKLMSGLTEEVGGQALEALGSLVRVKNSIAHGDCLKLRFTVGDASREFRKALEVVAGLESMLRKVAPERRP